MTQIATFMLKGLVPATFTPMKADGEVDFDKIEPYCKHLVKQGVKQIYINGTTAEGFSLTVEERKKVAEKWMEVGRKSGLLDAIVVQVGSLNLHDTLDLTRHAKGIGADAIASVPPLFFKPTTIDMLVKYCKDITDVAPELPFYFYHLPGATGVEPNVEDFLLAASKELPSLVGVKFSSKDLVDLIGCVHVNAPNREDKRYNMVYGCDEKLMAGIVTGADGSVGSTPNFMASVLNRVVSNTLEGKILEARKDQYRCQQTCKIMYKYGTLLGNNVAALKAIMTMIGMDLGPPRSPLRAPTQEELEAYKQDLTKLGFFDWYQ